jgi:hypothetical protein
MARRSNRSIGPIILLIGGILLIIASILVLLVWNFQPSISQDIPTSVVAEQSYPEIMRVNLQDAKSAYDTGKAVFVDVRGDEFYAQSHIPGALSIPLEDLVSRLQELDPSDWIITYCT